jgi:hypothetical protein
MIDAVAVKNDVGEFFYACVRYLSNTVSDFV